MSNEKTRRPHASDPAETLSAADTSAADRDLRLPKIISFGELCRCGDEVWIENGGQLYRLRRTRQGKLILTK